VTAPAELFLLHATSDFVDDLGAELDDVEASRTCTASDSESRRALA